jgi:hypothetical protein
MKNKRIYILFGISIVILISVITFLVLFNDQEDKTEYLCIDHNKHILTENIPTEINTLLIVAYNFFEENYVDENGLSQNRKAVFISVGLSDKNVTSVSQKMTVGEKLYYYNYSITILYIEKSVDTPTREDGYQSPNNWICISVDDNFSTTTP